MKKLALALICLVSVAFFASCDPIENPEPTIALMEGSIAENQIVDLNAPCILGIHVESNAQTNSPLATLVVTITDETSNMIIETTFNYESQTSYDYVDTLTFPITRDTIIGQAIINAVVTDEAGKTNTLNFKVNLNEVDPPLEELAFSWFRQGSGTVEFPDFGLQWVGNWKETHAQIKPMDGVILYQFEAADWANATTVSQKVALFLKAVETQQEALTVFNGVSTSASNDNYDFVLGTITPEDRNYHLIHITKCEIGEFAPAGYPITISGQAK